MFNKKDLMNLESLFMLSAIAQHKGKRKASNAFNTSVDTINKYIDSLEQDLGIKLLTSNGRGSVLTPPGHHLLESARKIKGILSDIYNITPPNGELKGEVRVGVNIRANPNLFLNNSKDNLGDFYDMYPDINIASVTTNDIPNMNEQSLDVGLAYDVPVNNDVVVINHVWVKHGLFASPEYLVKYGYPVDMDDLLENHRILTFSEAAIRMKGWKELLKRAKHICYTSNNGFAVIEGVRKGVGITQLPLNMKDEGLVCLDNLDYNVGIDFYPFAHKKRKDIPRVRAVINYYRAMLDGYRSLI